MARRADGPGPPSRPSLTEMSGISKEQSHRRSAHACGGTREGTPWGSREKSPELRAREPKKAAVVDTGRG